MQETLRLFEISYKTAYSKVKTSFILHSHVNKKNEQQILFNVHISGTQKKIPTGFYIEKAKWDIKKQRCKDNPDINLILDNMISKTTEIRTFFRLSKKQDQEMSMDNFLLEFFKKTPSYDFLSFFESQMNKKVTNANTLKKHKSVLKKLREYCGKLPFTNIDLQFFTDYRHHLYTLGNNKTTRNSNIKIIKYYLLDAQKTGIILNLNLSDLVVGSCAGNRTSLSVEDTQKLYKVFFLNVLTPSEQTSLACFLISCMTSLRISDLKERKRQDFLIGELNFTAKKTLGFHQLKINKAALNIILHIPELFTKKICEQVVNRDLKAIANRFKIAKKITMHVGRHTFATNFLKAGGTVQDLQIILDHSSLETTMIYVHMDKEESISKVNILDSFFIQ
ncbi:tyrosine-type recombinase/integrase [Epilithonimonas pallida]|uniref:Site-specific recombinase XerD n=1 Tax=Epilithonimonas pallida TaxID=373671 RepID=A0ABY1R4J0_9FLAO|nr:site-specific integrase [Epilithonimonas pallida]SMP94738.1 Site-specific recombinase XerD [Epilithonimonas pallida]